MAFDLASYAAECGVAEPERFVERCNLFRDYLLETNRTLNLTRITGVEEFAVKHVADSLAIARYFPEFREARLRVADIGCGAGFPSLVLALAFPNLLLTPIDSTGKKAAFVERAAQLLGLGNVRVVTARAVAPAPVIWKDAGNFTNRHGRFILYKTPEQAAEDLPALERLSAGRTIRWRTTEPFELPEEFGTRLFLYSLPR